MLPALLILTSIALAALTIAIVGIQARRRAMIIRETEWAPDDPGVVVIEHDAGEMRTPN